MVSISCRTSSPSWPSDDRTILAYPRGLHIRPAALGLFPELDFLADIEPHDLGGGSEWSVGPDALRRAFGTRVTDQASRSPPSCCSMATRWATPSRTSARCRRQSPRWSSFAGHRRPPGRSTTVLARLSRVVNDIPCARIRSGRLDDTVDAVLDFATSRRRSRPMTGIDTRAARPNRAVPALPDRPGHGLDRGDRFEHGADHPLRQSRDGRLRRTTRTDRPGDRCVPSTGHSSPIGSSPTDSSPRPRTSRRSGSSPRAMPRPIRIARSRRRTWSASSAPSVGRTAGSSSVASTTPRRDRRAGLVVERQRRLGWVDAWSATHRPNRTTAPVGRALLSRVPTRVITALMPWFVQEIRAEGR